MFCTSLRSSMCRKYPKTCTNTKACFHTTEVSILCENRLLHRINGYMTTSVISAKDVRIFLHLRIFGTSHWDFIKDLSTWLALPLQHDWNVHNSVCELPRVSVPSGSWAPVFTLHDLRDWNHLVDEVNMQDFNRFLHILNHGNLCCVATDIYKILPLCCACARLCLFTDWCSLEVMWSWTWSERCVVVNILSTVGTENTYTTSHELVTFIFLRAVDTLRRGQTLAGLRRCLPTRSELEHLQRLNHGTQFRFFFSPPTL